MVISSKLRHSLLWRGDIGTTQQTQKAQSYKTYEVQGYISSNRLLERGRAAGELPASEAHRDAAALRCRPCWRAVYDGMQLPPSHSPASNPTTLLVP